MCMPRIPPHITIKARFLCMQFGRALPASHPVGRHTQIKTTVNTTFKKLPAGSRQTSKYSKVNVAAASDTSTRRLDMHNQQTRVTPETPHVPNCGAAPLARSCFDSAHAVHSTNTTTAKHVQKAFDRSTTSMPLLLLPTRTSTTSSCQQARYAHKRNG
jgi:hypothetical protein